MSLSPGKIRRLGTAIQRQAALSKREIKYTVGFGGDTNPCNPYMFALILVGRANISVYSAIKGFWAWCVVPGSVFKINAPPEIPILSRVKMAAVDSSDTKKFFFFPARLRGERGGGVEL